MRSPNILLISIDTLRADHLSCYGYNKKTTPNIDKLAGEGTLFRQHYSTGVWTPPGHASMLTGLYVSEHGVYGENRLSDHIPTIAEKLKEYGYKTAGFINNSQVGTLVGFDKGHDIFVEVWKGVKSESTVKKIAQGIARRVKEKLGYEDMGAKRTNKLFTEWLEKRIDKNKAFYAFLHYVEPHNPLNPPRPYKNKYIKPLKNVDMQKVKKVAQNPLICFVEDLNVNHEETEVLKSLYDGEIAYIDSKIGEVMQMLKENDCYDDTMIIITSDHGEHFGEHNLWSHAASLYNEVLHIPLVIKFPKGMEYIQEVNNYTQLVDIFPTVMEIADINEKENRNSGISLVYRKDKNKFHDCVFAEWEGRVPYFVKSRLNDLPLHVNLNKFTNKMQMIICEKYKYISKSDGQEELYDLSSDIIEHNNLISQYQDIAARMKIKLAEWQSAGNREIVKEQSLMDEETRKNLERLGYM